MNKKTFMAIKLLTVTILASVISISVNIGNYILPTVAAISAFTFLILAKKK